MVKTRGRTTFKAGKDGAVAIHADYTFVYPLALADPDSTEVSRTIVRRVLDLELLNPAKYGPPRCGAVPQKTKVGM